MRGFAYERAGDAVRLAATHVPDGDHAPAQYFAGSTALLDLMKFGSWHPQALIDIGALRRDHAAIRVDADGLHLGALTRMNEVADHPDVLRATSVLAQSLQLAASPQLRNMASLAGTVLQRTRCDYFRDPSWPRCNKRVPGTGCGAPEGNSRHLAVLGVSEDCIAHHPGDFANALVALGAVAHLHGPDGGRNVSVEDLHRLPGNAPDVETQLGPGELITGFAVPIRPWFRRSLYLKVRDRQSSPSRSRRRRSPSTSTSTPCATRVAPGGVAAKPWRAHEAKAALRGLRLGARARSRACSTSSPTRTWARKPTRRRRTGRGARRPPCRTTMSGTPARSSASWWPKPTRPRGRRPTPSSCATTWRCRARTSTAPASRRSSARPASTRTSPWATPTQHHNPIELFSATAAWHDGSLTLYEPSQFVHGLRGALAKHLHLDIARIRVVSRHAGGAFDSKGVPSAQFMCGMIWGISSALHEATEIDPQHARYTNDNIAEYLIPVCVDVGEIDVIIVPETDEEVNPLGMKGVGELGVVGMNATVANAVYHATARRVRELPIRIERLL